MSITPICRVVVRFALCIVGDLLPKRCRSPVSGGDGSVAIAAIASLALSARPQSAAPPFVSPAQSS